METKNIKNLEITEETYNRALEAENAWLELKATEKRIVELQKKVKTLNSKWVSLDNAFQEEVNSDFDTSEIIREYQRRKEQ